MDNQVSEEMARKSKGGNGMMTPMGYLEKVACELRELSRRYYRQGLEDYRQRALDKIKSKYPAEVFYGGCSTARLVLLFGRSYFRCTWLTGGWLFREDQEGDLEIDIVDNAKPDEIEQLKEHYHDRQMTSAFPPTFQSVRDAERKILHRPSDFKKRYQDVINEFVSHLFEKQPDVDVLKGIMERMKDGVSPDMSETQAAAVLLKAVVEKLRFRSHASPEDTDPIWLVSELQFLVSTEFMEHEKRTAYFEDCYNQLLHAAALFFWEGASYAQWKSVVNQVFEVGSGRKVEEAEDEVDIFMRLLCGYCVPISEEQVALDLILRLLQTLEEMRQGKHKEDIEKVRARLAEKAEKKNSGKRAVH